MTDGEMALNYYRAGIEQRRPDYVPARVRLPAAVRGDFPFSHTMALTGDHDCESNQWGALSVRASDGSMLGIKPAEFEPIAWRHNAKAHGRLAEGEASRGAPCYTADNKTEK